jgi:hypothetical protein
MGHVESSPASRHTRRGARQEGAGGATVEDVADPIDMLRTTSPVRLALLRAGSAWLFVAAPAALLLALLTNGGVAGGLAWQAGAWLVLAVFSVLLGAPAVLLLSACYAVATRVDRWLGRRPAAAT